MKVEIISKENIKPSSPTPCHLKTYNFSMLDQFIPNVYAPLLFYYPNDHDGNNGISRALERSIALKKSLSNTLTQFYPLAGTINKNQLSIDCNDVGANFVCALVNRRLDEFLSYPDYRQINHFLPFEPSLDGSTPSDHVLNVQVNIFECGGIVIGFCVSHKIFDGAGFSTFLKGWTNMACGAKEVVCPNLNVSSLFPAKELLNGGRYIIANYGSFLRKGNFSTKRFVFDSQAIALLKTEAAKNGVHHPSRVDVVSAFVWKCAMAASKEARGVKKPSLFVHTVNLRRKLSTKLSKDLLGNLIWFSYALCPTNYEPTLHGLVNKVRQSISKINNEFVDQVQGDEGHVALVKSLKEMEEIGTNETTDCYYVTSMCKMGFNETNFGWGKPSWVTSNICNDIPVFMNLICLMDTKYGTGGIEVWVNIDDEEMKILQGNPELLSYASLDPSPLERQLHITSNFAPHFTTRNMDKWDGRKPYDQVLKNPGQIASGMVLERFAFHPKHGVAKHIWAIQKPYQIMFSTAFRKALRFCPK
uniref:stemmadenine O-acetyltransferase-like n=1 Tax=Erigeron canadensis TaxID=72917 RepID=UPI001CB8C970|nr:stemmadenine O-acetyltransferase-like [Erigeron canadensis]